MLGFITEINLQTQEVKTLCGEIRTFGFRLKGFTLRDALLVAAEDMSNQITELLRKAAELTEKQEETK